MLRERALLKITFPDKEMPKIEEDSCLTLHHFCFVLFWHPSSTADNYPIQIWTYTGCTNLCRTMPNTSDMSIRKLFGNYENNLSSYERNRPAFCNKSFCICPQNVSTVHPFPDTSVTDVYCANILQKHTYFDSAEREKPTTRQPNHTANQ